MFKEYKMIKFKGMPCPKCGKKGLHYSNHPHAFGWKDFYHVNCRYCNTTFKAEQIEELFEKGFIEKK
jgi:aspartate carbamoyltransferase regulatory subunit